MSSLLFSRSIRPGGMKENRAKLQLPEHAKHRRFKDEDYKSWVAAARSRAVGVVYG
jgi:hypothetical protein